MTQTNHPLQPTKADSRILIFGGTSESRELAETLTRHGHRVTLSVTTDYGREIAGETQCLVLVQRLDAEEMQRYLTANAFDCVIDATHPFAQQATQNIMSACSRANVKRLRLVREENDRSEFVTYVDSEKEAAELLDREPGNVLFAIGIRKLEAFANISDFSRRSFVRILPMVDSIEKALGLGVKSSQLICMHGPFDADLNRALIAMTKAKFLVTKDSGDEGGLEAKIIAARKMQCRVIVLNRPHEEGFSLSEILRLFGISQDRDGQPSDAMTFFPLFVDLRNKHVLIIGGGNVAERRAGILRRFGAMLTIVSPELTTGLEKLVRLNDIRHHKRTYRNDDIKSFSPFLVIAATNDRQVNHSIAGHARANNVFCIVSDRRNECDCHFPAIMESETFLAGLVSKDGNHHAVRDMAAQIRLLFNNKQNNSGTEQ